MYGARPALEHCLQGFARHCDLTGDDAQRQDSSSPVTSRHLSSSEAAQQPVSRRPKEPATKHPTEVDDVQRMTKRGADWLSTVAEDPELCRKQWADDPRRPCALPTGLAFDVVVTGQHLGVETFDQLVRRQMPVGPVMVDRAARNLGFFLPAKSYERFARLVSEETDSPPDYRYLHHGSFVVVPGPIPLADDRYQWLRAPNRRPETSPLRTASLAVMLVAAAELMERAEHYGERYSADGFGYIEGLDDEQGSAVDDGE